MEQTSHHIPQWIILNNQILDGNGKIVDLKKDKEACACYLKMEVMPKLRRFPSLDAKLTYLVDYDYYESDFLNCYSISDKKEIFKLAHDANFQFPSYMGAFKFYNDYALRSRDSDHFLESYADRIAVIALYHAHGDFFQAQALVKAMIAQDFIPATPTFLNTGKKQRGQFVSCFLLEAGDSLNDIARVCEFSMQLSKQGGGVSINLTNLRAKGESIKGIPHVGKGVVGVAKLLDNNFRYADQMGQRSGAGAAYLNVFHADIEDFLQTKKLNADDDVRLKTLSIGVVMPSKMLELAKEGKEMFLFYPHTIFQCYGKNFSDISINMDHWYDILVANPAVRKRSVNPRKLLEMIASLQGESGYPYIMYSDNVNNANPLADPVKFSNLCTEILQPTVTSYYADYDKRHYDEIGLDVSCNLASGHMGNMIEHNSIKTTVDAAMAIMNSVAEYTDISYVPAVARANRLNRSVGFGIMGHHGFLAGHNILFGSAEDLELIDVFFNAVNYYSLLNSMHRARITGSKFHKFASSLYADGSYFDGRGEILPQLPIVKQIFEQITLPSNEDWAKLKSDVMVHGLYNAHRLAVAPNGSTAYIMSATPSITPIKQLVEERTYGNSKTYFPMPHVDKTDYFYETAYAMSKFRLIDVIATAQKHVDQGISFELAILSSETTRDLQRYYLYAHHQGIKTLYYTRTQKLKIDECESCMV